MSSRPPTPPTLQEKEKQRSGEKLADETRLQVEGAEAVAEVHTALAETTTTGESGVPVGLLGFEGAFERLANQIVAMRHDSCQYHEQSELLRREQHEEAREQHAKEMDALRGLGEGLGTHVGRLETRVERIERHLFHFTDRNRLQQNADGLAVWETPSTDVRGYNTPPVQHSGEFVTTPKRHVSRSNRMPIGSARYKSVAFPSTPLDPRPTLLQSDGRTQFKSARYKTATQSATQLLQVAVVSALQSLGLVTVSKPQSKSVGPEGSGSPPPMTSCAKSNEEQKPNVTPASPNTPKPTPTMSTALPTLELPQELPVAGREVLLSIAAGVSQANPTACNPSTSGRTILPDRVDASNLEGCGQVRPLPPSYSRVSLTQSSGPEEEVGVHVQDEILVLHLEMETPTPQADRYRPGTRWTHEELAAVRDLLCTLHRSPSAALHITPVRTRDH